MGLKKIVFSISFIALILLSFGIKTVEFDNPYSGFHLVRQLDNLIAMEQYFLEGIEIKRRLPGGGKIVFEFPLYQALSAYLSSSLDEVLFYARSVNLMFAFLSIILLFKIASIWFDTKTAIFSTLFFTFSPLNLAYQRAVMMDISTVFFCLTATWILLEYFKDKERVWLLPLFVIAGGLSVITKALYFFPVGAIALANFVTQYRAPFSINSVNYIKRNLGLVISFVLIVALMIGWLWVVKVVNDPGILNDLGPAGLLTFLLNWSFLFSSKYYALIIFRFVLLILNPFTFLFFVIGMVLIWKRYWKKDCISLPFFIPLYFLFFGMVNFPHEYYSLIMVPYCSLVAGVGAVWLEEVLTSNNLIKGQEWSQGILCVFSSVISVLIFFLNFLVGSPNIDQRAVEIEQEMRSVIEPRNISHIYINKANFPLIDYIIKNRSLYLLYVFNIKSESDVRAHGRPITKQELFYSLKQFGSMELTQGGLPKMNIELLRQENPKNLRYVMFYKYSEEQKSQIKQKMVGYQALYESNDWLVYDMKMKNL